MNQIFIHFIRFVRKEINYFILKLYTIITWDYIYFSKITKFSVLLNARDSSNIQYEYFFLSRLFSYVNLFSDKNTTIII